MPELAVKLIGPAYDVSGISQCVREIALALYDNGVEMNIVDMPNFCGVKPEIEPDKIRKLKIMEQRLVLVNPYVAIHFYPLDRAGMVDDKAKANIFFSMYETDRIPYYWKLILNKKEISEVWVPSEFNKESYSKSKVDRDKIQVVNLGVDLDKYNPKNQRLEQFNDKANFYFSYVSELKLCKGFELLLKAFFEEFANDPTAKLIFKCTSSDNKQDIERIANIIKSFKGNSKAEILFLFGSQSETFMKHLYASADCFVLPSRGEGWGLGIIQSMASGVPVITTNCSAQTTYCNSNNSMLIDTNLEKIHDIGWLKEVPVQNEHWWFEPNYMQLRQKMRYAFENRNTIKAKAETARKNVENFSWNNTSLQIIKQLKKFL